VIGVGWVDAFVENHVPVAGEDEHVTHSSSMPPCRIESPLNVDDEPISDHPDHTGRRPQSFLIMV